jgi:serine protease Do
MKHKAIVRSLAAAGMAGVLAAGAVHYDNLHAAPQPAPVASQPQAASAVAALPDFAQLVERNGPAVVNIRVEQNVKASAALPDFGITPDNPMYEFFRHFEMPGPQTPMPTRGLGSGFIVSQDGLILTNAHVVANAAEVTVKLSDRREFKAKVIGTDPQTDVAALKIDATNLPTVTLGSAQNVRVGEWVVAIGSPFGFENTVTSGIVSATSRALPDGSAVPFIQTDVALNPGNSGGPLFNMKGEVIGINSQIYSRSGGYQGLSFAIPIDTALFVKDQLVAHGKVTRGRLGVTVQELNQSLASSFGLKSARGALVSSVQDGTPAAQAGLEPGDVVLKLDGKEIAGSLDLSSRVARIKPGTTAKLEVWRDGKPRELAVRVGEAPSQQMASADAQSDLSKARIGVAVRSLTEAERKQAEVEGGLVVEQASGAAARAGIRPGDIILSVNGSPVRSVEDLQNAAQSRKTLAVLVKRNDARIFVPVQVG